MGCKGCALAYMGQGHQPQEAHAQEIRKKGRVLKGEGTSEVPWGGRTPPWPHPSLKEGARLRPPLSLGLIYRGGKGGQQHLSLGRLPPPLQHLSLSRISSAKPCRHPAASTTTPSCCSISINLSSPLLDQEGGDVAAPYVC